jgi:hypothetical protein
MTFLTHGGHIEEGIPQPRIEPLYRGGLSIGYLQEPLPIVLLASDHLTAPDDVYAVKLLSQSVRVCMYVWL